MENVYVNRFNKELELFSERLQKFNCNFNLSEYADMGQAVKSLVLEYEQIVRDGKTLDSLGFKTEYELINDHIFILQVNFKNNYINLLKDLYEESVSSMETRDDAEKASVIKKKIKNSESEFDDSLNIFRF